MNPLVDVAAVLVVGGLHHRHVHVCQGALPRRRVRRQVVEGAAPVPCAAELLALLGCVSDETVLDPLFSTVSRPFRTVLRGLGAGFWNLGGQMEKMAKKREKTGKKWARNGLKKVGPMTD